MGNSVNTISKTGNHAARKGFVQSEAQHNVRTMAETGNDATRERSVEWRIDEVKMFERLLIVYGKDFQSFPKWVWWGCCLGVESFPKRVWW
jgi:hypothetical protein